MIKKYVLIVDTEKEPFVDCSLTEFFDTVDILDFQEGELTKEERDEIESS